MCDPAGVRSLCCCPWSVVRLCLGVRSVSGPVSLGCVMGPQRLLWRRPRASITNFLPQVPPRYTKSPETPTRPSPMRTRAPLRFNTHTHTLRVRLQALFRTNAFQPPDRTIPTTKIPDLKLAPRYLPPNTGTSNWLPRYWWLVRGGRLSYGGYTPHTLYTGFDVY